GPDDARAQDVLGLDKLLFKERDQSVALTFAERVLPQFEHGLVVVPGRFGARHGRDAGADGRRRCAGEKIASGSRFDGGRREFAVRAHVSVPLGFKTDRMTCLYARARTRLVNDSSPGRNDGAAREIPGLILRMDG